MLILGLRSALLWEEQILQWKIPLLFSFKLRRLSDIFINNLTILSNNFEKFGHLLICKLKSIHLNLTKVQVVIFPDINEITFSFWLFSS